MNEVITWVSVEQRLPTTRREVLTRRVSFDHIKVCRAYQMGLGWWASESELPIYGVSHWAELPQGPSDPPKPSHCMNLTALDSPHDVMDLIRQKQVASYSLGRPWGGRPEESAS